MPGTLPTRLTTTLSLLLPVRTLTALLMVMFSRLMPFTSTSLSPTSKPASSVEANRWCGYNCVSYSADGAWRGLFTCRAVVLHLTNENTETMFGSPPHAEAQPAIYTFVHSDGMEVLTVIST